MEKTIKIFISSPGDVVHERQIAKRVIKNLEHEFSSAGVTLEALLWEDMPLQATSSFQEGINQIVDTKLVDIAVFILWSRLGSPLKDFLKPDGSVYKSGTEYEFDMMYKANQQSGSIPSILAYIKNTPISIVLSQSGNVDFEELEQHKDAQRFIQEKFYDPHTKTVYGAYHQFDAPTSFEQKLTEHLRRLIIDKIGFKPTVIEWTGNPYVGLRSFTKEENSIFFGRKRNIEIIKSIISEKTSQNNDTTSVFILGESGSGKSSLIRAGLLPNIIESGFNGHYEWNEPYEFTFSRFRGEVYNEIVKILVDAFPSLEKTAFGKDLIAKKDVNFNHIADCLASNKSTVFFIDQFEELFTDPLITEEERVRSLALLHGIAASRKIWMFFSMRNDFYHKFTAYPTLLELKRESILYDLPQMSSTEFQEIVEEPAKKAGLSWELKNGEGLNKQIINDINSGINELSLIEFALSELYNLKDEKNQLTFDAYNEIDGVNGAVIKYVDDFYNSLPDDEKKLFYQMLSALIAPSAKEDNLYVRKTALREDLQKNEKCKILINKLIDKHILISNKDANGNATVSIVHEILISSWQIIKDWIKQENYFININNHYENMTKYWIEHDKPKSDLLREKATVKEAEYFLYSWKDSASKNVTDFLNSSVKRRKRNYLSLAIIALSINIFSLSEFIFKDYADRIIDLDIDLYSFLYTQPIVLTILFGYLVWIKILAVPKFKTINVSLIVWTALFSISTFDLLYNLTSDLWRTFCYAPLSIFILIKLASIFVEKREIKLWSKCSFKSSSKISSTHQKRIIITGISYLAIIIAANIIHTNLNAGSGDGNNKGNVFNLHVDSRLPDYKAAIKTAYELGDYDNCRDLLSGYKTALINTTGHSIREFDANMISLAENIGAFDLVKDVYDIFENIDEDNTLMIKKAHALLMTGDKENALSIYRKQVDASGDSKGKIEKDFSIFRWLGFSDTEISLAEKELNLDIIPVNTKPADEKDMSPATPFFGKWKREDENFIFTWDLTQDHYNSSYYLMQTKEPVTDFDMEVTHFRIKQIDGKTVLEQYNPRYNRLNIREIEIVDEDELKVTLIESSKPDSIGPTKFYKRVTE